MKTEQHLRNLNAEKEKHVKIMNVLKGFLNEEYYRSYQKVHRYKKHIRNMHIKL